MTSILILNGPNLNLLGARQPEIYGRKTLSDIEAEAIKYGQSLGRTIVCQQSNHEGALVDAIQSAKGKHNGIILNAAAFTHTSVALLDTITAVEVPVIELHLSNTQARETFRHTSFISKAALGLICGFGAHGYILAIDALDHHLKSQEI